MALRKYLKKGDLPTAKETGIGALATKEANAAVSRVIQESPGSSSSRKRKRTVFSPEQRAAIGRYAAENSNIAAVKKFKGEFELGESTVQSFKIKYLDELDKLKEKVPAGEVATVSEIVTKPTVELPMTDSTQCAHHTSQTALICGCYNTLSSSKNHRNIDGSACLPKSFNIILYITI